MNDTNKHHFFCSTSFKKCAFIILFLVVAVRIIYYTATEGFCPDRIYATSSQLKEETHTEASPPFPQELRNCPFYYLKKGSQAYAFQSSDKRYVLKLFKRHHMQEAAWLQKIPTIGPLTTWKNTLLQKRQRRLQLALHSYVIATTLLTKQCGILSYQLEPIPGTMLDLDLIDGIGRKHTISLDRCGYVLQYKASLVFPALTSWIEKKEYESAQKAISSLVELVSYRSKLGIQDVDPDIHKNAGYLGTEAIFIDIGSFTQTSKPIDKESFAYDIQKITKELRAWLLNKEPSLASFLDKTIEEAIKKY